jgi:hypothetical protein
VQKFGAGAFVEDGTPPSEWPSPLDEAIAQHEASTSAERRAAQRAGGPRLLTTKYRARKAVSMDIDGEKRRVRRGELLEGNDPLRSLADAEPVQVEA